MQPFAWNDFYTSTKNRPPWPCLVQAVELLKCGDEALDLGCGAGRDTRYLLASGFRVTAVDQESVSLELLADLPPDRLHRVQSPFEDFQFGYYDLINAHFALPFIGREQFPLVFARLKDALKPGAIFVGQFFGVNDSWNSCSLYGQVFPAYTTRLNLRPLTSLSTPKDPTGRAVPLRGTGILASTAHAARGAVL